MALAASPAAAHGPRVAEVVSPPDNNGDLGVLGFLAPSGDRVGYRSSGIFEGAPETGDKMTYLAARTPGGWVTEPVLTAGTSAPLATSDSSDRVLWSTSQGLDPQDLNQGSSDLFVRDGTVGPVTRITRGPLNDSGINATFAGANGDLTKVLFETSTALEPPDDARTAGTGLYEWNDGTLANVTVPDSAAAQRGVALGGGPTRPRTHALSADGSRLVLTSPSSPSATLRSALWTKDGSSDAVRLTPSSTQDERFDGASADGSTVVLSTKEGLTPGDTDSTQLDIYSVNVSTGTASLVSTGPLGGNGTGCTLSGFSGCEARTAAVSDDGSTIAFVSPEVLVAGATANKANLYVRRAGTTSFVDTLKTAAEASQSRISQDGSKLIFLSAAALTGDDTDTSTDLFLWDATSGAVTRLSQGGPGFEGNGASNVVFNVELPGYAGGGGIAPTVTPRNLSADGTCAFFQTTEALTAADINGNSDVYQVCDGTLALVSGGTGGDSNFVNASSDGTGVLIVTTDALSSEDVDGGVSLYEMREGGRVPPPPPTRCVDDACQPPPSGAPSLPSPVLPSSGVAGAEAPGGEVLLTAPGDAARRRASRKGRLPAKLAVPAAGTATFTLTARVGKKTVTLARKTVKAKRAGTVRTVLRLRKRARRTLRTRGLPAVLVAHFVGSGVNADDSARFKLPRVRGKKR